MSTCVRWLPRLLCWFSLFGIGCSATQHVARSFGTCSAGDPSLVLATPRTPGCARRQPPTLDDTLFLTGPGHLHEMSGEEPEYRAALEKTFPRAYSRDVILVFEVHPPFSPEWVVGLRRRQSGEVEAFLFEASSSVWSSALKERNLKQALQEKWPDDVAEQIRRVPRVDDLKISTQSIPFSGNDGSRLAEAIGFASKTAHVAEPDRLESGCFDDTQIVTMVGPPETRQRLSSYVCPNTCLGPRITAAVWTLRIAVQQNDTNRQVCRKNLAALASEIGSYDW